MTDDREHTEQHPTGPMEAPPVNGQGTILTWPKSDAPSRTGRDPFAVVEPPPWTDRQLDHLETTDRTGVQQLHARRTRAIVGALERVEDDTTAIRREAEALDGYLDAHGDHVVKALESVEESVRELTAVTEHQLRLRPGALILVSVVRTAVWCAGICAVLAFVWFVLGASAVLGVLIP